MKNDFFDHLPPFYHPIPLFSGFIEFFFIVYWNNQKRIAMNKIEVFIRSKLANRLTIDVGVFLVFLLVTFLFVLTIVRSF